MLLAVTGTEVNESLWLGGVKWKRRVVKRVNPDRITNNSIIFDKIFDCIYISENPKFSGAADSLGLALILVVFFELGREGKGQQKFQSE